MGEDQTDDLQEQEELEELQEPEELQGLEDALAEEYASEDGGTGLSFYNEDGYDYNASSPLTDVDYQSGTDESSAYTSNNIGADDYDPLKSSRNQDGASAESAEDADGSSLAGELSRWKQPAQRLNNDDDDDEDDEAENDVDEDEDDDDEDEDDDDEQGEGVVQSSAKKKNDYDGAIKWKPGQPITVKLLDQVWGKCRNIKKVRPLVDTLNQAVDTALNTTGPNLTLRLHRYIEKTNDDEMDTVGCLLKLAKQNGKRMTYTAISAVEAIFDQQWTQTALLASMNEATLQAILMVPQVKAVATTIFTIAVPMINKMDREKKQS